MELKKGDLIYFYRGAFSGQLAVMLSNAVYKVIKDCPKYRKERKYINTEWPIDGMQFNIKILNSEKIATILYISGD